MKQIVKLENVFKVFGHSPRRAIDLYRKGKDKDTIFRETKNAIAVANASFEIYEGETLVIMGLSGSGKSTLLRCINRLIKPSSGNIIIEGIHINKLNEKELMEFRRKKFGMVFQKFALFPHRTILENIAYGLEIQNVPKKERLDQAREALALVGLQGWDNFLPSQLSGGMQQRVGLARALAVNPDILLMDEAFSALDPLIRTEMQDELLSLESAVKKTIIFITHDLDEALKMGDRIILMKDGEIVQIGTPEEILTRPANEYVRKFLENVDMTKVLTAEDVMGKAKRVTFLKDGPVTALHKMREGGMSDIFVVKQNFELLGYVTADAASKAVKEGNTQLHTIIEDYDAFTVLPDTPVKNLFRLVINTNSPVAVVNESKKLLGTIVKGSLLAGLAERGEINEYSEL